MTEKTKDEILQEQSNNIPEMTEYLEYCEPNDILHVFYDASAFTILNSLTNTLLIYNYDIDEVKVGLWEEEEELAFVDNGEDEMEVFDAYGNEIDDYFE